VKQELTQLVVEDFSLNGNSMENNTGLVKEDGNSHV
jgi:hypothetical protein